MLTIDLKDRVALVTGSGQGIGFGIARALHECGARVVVNDLDERRANEAASALGGKTLALAGDVSTERDGEAVVAAVCRDLGGIDVLVNNAGIGGQRARTLDQSGEAWERVVDVDLRGPYLMSKAAGRRMCAQRRGAIVNIASVAGIVSMAADNDYGVAKAGLIHLTKAMALDFASHGVRVNCIAPGLIETPLAVEYAMPTAERRERMIGTIPLAVVGQPDDIGRMAAFLVSDLARYVTGVCVPVDGGMSAGSFPPRRRQRADDSRT